MTGCSKLFFVVVASFCCSAPVGSVGGGFHLQVQMLLLLLYSTAENITFIRVYIIFLFAPQPALFLLRKLPFRNGRTETGDQQQYRNFPSLVDLRNYTAVGGSAYLFLPATESPTPHRWHSASAKPTGMCSFSPA